jgi:hypothetical protein
MTKTTCITCDECEEQITKENYGIWTVTFESNLLGMDRSLYFCKPEHMIENLNRNYELNDDDKKNWSE